MSTRVIIVEDDTQTRESITIFLRGTPGYEVSGSYASAEEALSAGDFGTCDILLTDIGLPGIDGIHLISEVRKTYHRLQCIVLTVFEDDDHVFNALKAGAVGYILKGSRPSKLLDSIDEAMAGGSPMTGTIARRVLDSFRQQESPRSEELTPRENEILAFLAEGLRYKEIAAALDLKVDTVRTHIRNIYQKLQVQSRTEALNKVRGNS